MLLVTGLFIGIFETRDTHWWLIFIAIGLLWIRLLIREAAGLCSSHSDAGWSPSDGDRDNDSADDGHEGNGSGGGDGGGGGNSGGG